MPFDLSGLGDILSAGGGIADTISSIFGGGSGDKKANKLAKKQLEFMMRMATAGQEDALGNKMYFDKSTNSWKVKLNPTSRATQVASDQEELNRLIFDLPRERVERGEAAEARTADSEIADTLRRRIIDRSPMTADRLEGELYNAKSRGIRETTDKLGNQLATQGLRSGVNPGRSLDELSRTLARELGNASSDSRLEALTGADDINARRGNTAIDQYGAMESRARNVSNTPFNPASLSAGLEAISAGRQGALGAVGSAGRNAIITGGVPQSDYGKLGTAAGSLFDVLGDFMKKKKEPTTTVGNATY
jgi:hypothetical protein